MKPRPLFRNLVWLLPVAIILGFSAVAQAQPDYQTWSGPFSFAITKTQRSDKTGTFVKVTEQATGTVKMFMEVDGGLVSNAAGNYMEFTDDSGILQVAFKQLQIITTNQGKSKTKTLSGVGAGEFYYNQTGGPPAGPACATISGTAKLDAPGGNLLSVTATLTMSGAGINGNNGKEFVWSGKPKATLVLVP